MTPWRHPGRSLPALALLLALAPLHATLAEATAPDPPPPTDAPSPPAPSDRAGQEEPRGQEEPERQEEPEGQQGQEEPEGQADGPEASRVTATPGRTVLGGYVSRGLAQEINGSSEIDVTTVAARWSRIYGSPGDRFLGGHPGFGVEIYPAMLFHQGPTAWAAGFHLVYEHRFVTDGVLPVLRLGAGFLYGPDRVPPGETRHNFSLLAGLGVDIPVARTTALSLEYRLHHVSNSNTGDRNPGINAHTLVAGLSFYF